MILLFNIDITKIHNPFGVDFSQNAAINLLAKEILVSQYRNLTKYYADYSLSINDVLYPIVILNPSESLTEGILTITVSWFTIWHFIK
jgi:hypothetical protein